MEYVLLSTVDFPAPPQWNPHLWVMGSVTYGHAPHAQPAACEVKQTQGRSTRVKVHSSNGGCGSHSSSLLCPWDVVKQEPQRRSLRYLFHSQHIHRRLFACNLSLTKLRFLVIPPETTYRELKKEKDGVES